MRVVPKNRAEQISFFTARLDAWASDPAAIGLTVADVEVLRDQVEAAQLAHSRQGELQNQARAATQAYHASADQMHRTGAGLLKKIRAQAEADGQEVYTQARVPEPRKKSPIGDPGKPDNFGTQLLGNGAFALTWTCENPRGSVGTMYLVRRALGGSEEFEYLGTVGTKRFVDTTLPAGPAKVTYRVQAIRSTRVGPIASHSVMVGGTAALPPPMHLAA
jgi:hypothetical protein